VVDELLAQRLFGSDDPIVKMVEAPLHGNDVAFEIIGVVRATRYYDLHQTPPSMFFYNLQQAGPYMPTLHVRVGSANPEFVASEVRREFGVIDRDVDRKSTRLNSSHVKISYAVFCLKKKKKKKKKKNNKNNINTYKINT